ncbi:MAG: FecR family protein [Mariniphaga sp.]|nr:FecR family protein [Mariniphaga sp.]
MKDEQLIDFITGKITDQSEIKAVMDWIEKSPENRKTYNDILNSWALSGIRYGNHIVDVDLPFRQFKRRNFKTRLITEFLKYAAAILIIFSIGALSQYFVSNNILRQDVAWQEVTAPFGQSVELSMSDSTKVWLNSGTKLRYPSNFSSNKRVVELNGEAFFEVTSDKKHPFIIKTTSLDVKVTGTRFNVDAYSENDKANITLVEGKVAIQNKNGSMITELNPNMNAEFIKSTNKLKLKKVNVEFYTSWTTGTIVFQKESLEEIAKKLEKWYNVKIVFDQVDIKDIAFSGSILKNKPIDQILEILTYTSRIGYQMETMSNQPNIIHLKHLPMKK